MTPDDHKRVSDAVHAAEAGTAGEIVTIVADRSDGYLDVALIYAILAMLFVPILFAAFPSFADAILDVTSRGWGDHPEPARYLLVFALMTAVFLLVRLALTHEPLRLRIAPKGTRRRRVHARAIELFRVGTERRTTGRTGILIYLSMGEHMAEIVADQAIHSKVSEEAWGEAMAALIAEVREGRVTDGMIAAIGKVGAILGSHLPRETDDANELPNRLIEL
ncbi:MAG: TPM domain-containing protein [Sphingomonadaceae bacterium]